MPFFCNVDQVYFYPSGNQESPGLILSCGIHGDETGPIKAIDALKATLDRHQTPPPFHVLLIYGNPRAINLKQRFDQENLNRLFGLKQKPKHPEGQRANALEKACLQFSNQCSSVALHLDLHSTIKPSRIPRFALHPVTSYAYQADWSLFFHQAGIQACVRQTIASSTFSQFTRDNLHCDSFTVECGTSDSGHGQCDDHELLNALSQLVFNGPGIQSSEHYPPMGEYTVVHSITQSGDLEFIIDELEPNFTPHPPGTPIYRKSDSIYLTERETFTLFLNSGVGNGQRAGLLLTKDHHTL